MTSTRSFLLPDLGEGLTEAQVLDWLVAEGDVIAVDQPVVEVETAKAAVQVPCPFAGVVSRLHAGVGDVVDVGKPLITVSAQPGLLSEPGVVTPEEVAVDAGSGNVLVGYGTAPEGRRRRRSNARGKSPSAAVPVTAAALATAPSRPRVQSPVVRRLARTLNVELATLSGSGRDGLILRRDVETAARAAATPAQEGSGEGGERRVKLTGARRTAARHLAVARREIPEATVWVDVDATRLGEARRRLNQDPAREPVSVLGLLARFTVAALRAHPELNARYDADTEELVLQDTVGLGVAAQTSNGLVVPVVRDAHLLSTRQLSAALRTLVTKAREGELTTHDLTGGTCTLNNYGVFGVDGSAAIINAPEVAIVGVGRILQRPWVVDGRVEPRDVTELTLSFDHRVCDGGTAASFLGFIRDCVHDPQFLLGDV